MVNQVKYDYIIYGCGDIAIDYLKKFSTKQLLLVDDDNGKIGKLISGIEIKSTDLIRETKIDRSTPIVVALSRVKYENQIERIKNLLTQLGYNNIIEIPPINPVFLTSLNDYFSEHYSNRILKSKANRNFRDKVVLVTGAAGSIGSELVGQLIKLESKLVVALDSSEIGIFNLQKQFSNSISNHRLITILADITDASNLFAVLQKYKFNEIYHAAAYKHVKISEENPYMAMKVNVIGTYNILEVAKSNPNCKFVLISTDKAVNPTTFMGATKRLAELLCLSSDVHGMHNKIVRFGNVLGSSGSVFTIFAEQLKNQEALTVTHKDARRYFMTIPDAVFLVLRALDIGPKMRQLHLDMGKSYSILQAAKDFIEYYGFSNDKKDANYIPITITSLSSGEKLDEILHDTNEVVRSSNIPGIMYTQFSPSTHFPEYLNQIKLNNVNELVQLVRAYEIY